MVSRKLSQVDSLQLLLVLAAALPAMEPVISRAVPSRHRGSPETALHAI